MSGTHGVFQHRTGYFYTILEEDFCEMYKKEGVNEICRAYITSILEHETNKRFEAAGSEEGIWIWMSLPELARRMRNAYSERTIHKEIQGMVEDGYLRKRRAPGKAVMEYSLNLKKIREGISSLPDKEPCRIATSNLAELQDQSGKIARLTLQNCKNDLAELQPRINNRINIEEPKEEESIADETKAVASAPIVAPSPSFSSENPKEKVPSKKKNKKEEPEPKGPPQMPPADMTWGTKKCLMMFDAWRGNTLIGTYKNSQASTCAKGLAEKYTEEEVTKVYEIMCEDPYWIGKGGVDVCNVANNIHKEIKKVKNQKQPVSHSVQTGARPSVLVSEERRQKNIEKMLAGAAAKAAKE